MIPPPKKKVADPWVSVVSLSPERPASSSKDPWDDVIRTGIDSEEDESFGLMAALKRGASRSATKKIAEGASKIKPSPMEGGGLMRLAGKALSFVIPGDDKKQSETLSEKAIEMLGGGLADLPANIALGSGVGQALSSIGSKVNNPIAKAMLTKTAKVFNPTNRAAIAANAAISSIPENAVSTLALTAASDPSQLASKEGWAQQGVSTLVASAGGGLLALRGAGKALQDATAPVPAQPGAQSAPPTASPRFEEKLREASEHIKQFRTLLDEPSLVGGYRERPDIQQVEVLGGRGQKFQPYVAPDKKLKVTGEGKKALLGEQGKEAAEEARDLAMQTRKTLNKKLSKITNDLDSMLRDGVSAKRPAVVDETMKSLQADVATLIKEYNTFMSGAIIEDANASTKRRGVLGVPSFKDAPSLEIEQPYKTQIAGADNVSRPSAPILRSSDTSIRPTLPNGIYPGTSPYHPPNTQVPAVVRANVAIRPNVPAQGLTDAEAKFNERIEAYTGESSVDIASRIARFKEVVGNLGGDYVNYKRGLVVKPEGGSKAIGNPMSLYNQANMLSGIAEAARRNMQEGVQEFVDGKWQTTAPSLEAVLKTGGTSPRDMTRLSWYLHAKQAAEANADAKAAMGREESEALIAEMDAESPKWKEAAEMMKQRFGTYRREMLRVGAISQETLEAMEKSNPYYFSQGRVMNNPASPSLPFLRQRTDGGSVKKIKESWGALVENEEKMLSHIKHTEFFNDMANRVDADPDAWRGMIEVQPLKQAEVDALIARHPTLPAKQALELAMLEDGFLDGTDKSIIFRRNGVPTKLRFAGETLPFFEGFTQRQGGAAQKVAARVGKYGDKPIAEINAVLRDLSSYGPVMDVIEAYFNSTALGAKFNPLKDPIAGFKEMYLRGGKLSAEMRQVISTGGGISGRYVGSSGETGTQFVDELRRGAQGAKLKTMNPLELLRQISGVVSNSIRAGVAVRAMKNDATPAQAAFLARNILADPAQVGAKMKAFSLATAYGNFGIQANARLIDNLRLGGKAELGKQATKMIVRGVSLVTSVSALEWALSRDDDELRRVMSNSGGDKYWHFRSPLDGEIVNLPKPYIYGSLFGTSATSALRALEDVEPARAKQVAEGLIRDMAINVAPLTAQLGIELMTGVSVDGITGGGLNIDPGGSAGLMAQDRSRVGGTQIAKDISGALPIDMSAAMVENVMRSVAGGEGFRIIDYFDRLANPDTRAAPDRANLPLIGRWSISKETISSRDIQDMYELDRTLGEVQRSYDSAVDKGQATRAREIYNNQENMEMMTAYQVIVGIKQGLDEQRQKYREIASMEGIDPRVRRAQMEQIADGAEEAVSAQMQAIRPVLEQIRKKKK